MATSRIYFLSIETVNQLGRFLCFAIAAVGIDLVWGYTGILTLCQAMFFVFGGYCVGMHLALHGPLSGDLKDVPRCLYVVTSDVKGFHLPFFWQPFQTLPAALLLVILIPGITAFLSSAITCVSQPREGRLLFRSSRKRRRSVSACSSGATNCASAARTA